MNSATAFKQPTKAVENANMMEAFNEGEYLFEKEYNTNTDGAFHGLGPVYIRRGCLYCHPGYGHGARQTSYKANAHRNGYLLVVYDKTTNAYVRSLDRCHKAIQGSYRRKSGEDSVERLHR